MIGTIIAVIKNYTCRIYLVRLVAAQFITRPLSERVSRATLGREREIAPTDRWIAKHSSLFKSNDMQLIYE